MPTPEDANLIRTTPGQWTNYHGTVTAPIDAEWRVTNSSDVPTMAAMRDTAARLQRLIRHAASEGKQLRPVGSRWSFSDIAVAEHGWALQTDRLNFDFEVGPGSIDPAFAGDAAGLVLAQCGASIAEINRKIEAAPRLRSLRTSGASNGQTIGGALGTGIHGSAIDRGGLEAEVLGLQLLSGDRNRWIEHPDRPALNAAFAQRLGAELVRDAKLFAAAQVSLGALGVVHAALLQTVPRYRLRSFLRKMPVAEVIGALKTLDFTGVDLPIPGQRPYFIQMVVDPAKPKTGYVTTRYREDCPADYVTQAGLKSGYEAGHDLPGLFATLLQAAPRLRPGVVSLLLKTQLSPFENKLHTPAETYTYTTSKPGTAGGSMAVPAARLDEALALANQAFAAHPDAPGAYACRFAQASPALLGFTRYDPTCIIDVDGLASPALIALMERIRENFDAAGMPYAQHWGKRHGLTAARVQRSHGDRLADWQDARETLLSDPAERRVFSSPLLDRIGLT